MPPKLTTLFLEATRQFLETRDCLRAKVFSLEDLRIFV